VLLKPSAPETLSRRGQRNKGIGTKLLRGVWFLCVLLLIVPSNVLLAQLGRGQIEGTIRDSSDAVILQAQVVVIDERTGATRTTTTNSQGSFTVAQLLPSTYTVKATVSGFQPAEAKDVVLAVGSTRSVDFALKPASQTQTVTVTGAAEVPFDTASARMGANVIQKEVEGLPINGRQLSQLYLQAPGALNSGSGTFSDIRFSGMATQQNAIRYDGVEGSAIIDANPGNLNGEIPSPFRLQSSLENVQEFRVESNSYPAEYGTGTGGQIVVVSKSGSNQFHGSVFEYFRNDTLDARNFFDLSQKSPLRQNQFGGSLGGPIKKNKFFFFGSFEAYRLRSGLNFIEAAPSAVACSRAVAAVAPLCPNAFRTADAVLLPGASTNPDFDILQLQSSGAVDENAVGVRFDYRINDRNSLFVRYYRDQGTNDQPEGITGRRAHIRAVPQNAVVSWQSSLTSSLLNEAKVGFNEALTRVNGLAPVVNGIDLSALTLSLTGSVANSGIAGQGASTGIATPGGLLRQNSATNGRGAPYTPYTISWIDNLTLAKGSHTIKTGGEFRRIRMWTDRQGGTTYTYSNLDAFLANTLQQVQYLGDVSAPSPFNNGATGWRLAKQYYIVGYAQDEWRIRPTVTLNYGLRYDYYKPLSEEHNLDVLFNMTDGTLRPPDSSFFHSRTADFQPRVSLAWAPAGKLGPLGGRKTVLRGGFGIYVGPGQTEDQIQPIESDRISSTISGGAFPVDPAVLTANFILNPDNRAFQPRAYAPEYTIPERVYEYSFSIQQQLPSQMLLTAAYVGSQGRNMFLRSVTNRIMDVQTNPDPTQKAIVIRQFDIVNPDGSILHPYAEIDFKTSGGEDRYDALQASLVRRFNSGLTLNAQYTWARSYGNTGGSNDAQTTGNPYDYSYDFGYNLFDVRQIFNVSAMYDLPFGKGQRYLSNGGGIAQALLGNWQMSTILNARSGLPVDLRITRPDVVYLDGAGNYLGSPCATCTAVINTLGGGASRNVRRPDLVPGVPIFLNNDRTLLNPAAFAIPQPGTFGSVMRGMVHGPGFHQFDFALAKTFSLGETANIQFRTDFFNLFNHPNFANPPGLLPNALGTGTNQLQPGQPFTSAAAGSWGILNSTVTRTVGLGANRQIEFALRISF
jgi:hypothetical protein